MGPGSRDRSGRSNSPALILSPPPLPPLSFSIHSGHLFSSTSLRLCLLLCALSSVLRPAPPAFILIRTSYTLVWHVHSNGGRPSRRTLTTPARLPRPTTRARTSRSCVPWTIWPPQTSETSQCLLVLSSAWCSVTALSQPRAQRTNMTRRTKGGPLSSEVTRRAPLRTQGCTHNFADG